MTIIINLQSIFKAMAILACVTLLDGCVKNIKKLADTTIYNIKPDYRKCAFPMCGGWFLTPVNHQSTSPQTNPEANKTPITPPESIYIASLDFKHLNLLDDKNKELETAMRSGKVLVRGNIKNTTSVFSKSTTPNQFIIQTAWVGDNKSNTEDSYFKIVNSGIVCITTPCPYFNAEFINTAADFNFDELSFTKTNLSPEQEAQARQLIAKKGLIVTAEKYESEGKTGKGVGLSITKIFSSVGIEQ